MTPAMTRHSHPISADIADLIARLEAASEGNWTLDAEIVIALDMRPDWCKEPGELWIDKTPYMFPVIRWRSDALGKRRSGGNPPIGDPLPYTRSIDAALTLVPEGYPWGVHDDSGRSFSCATVVIPDARNEFVKSEEKGRAKTPALALCIAALKARAEVAAE